MDGININRDFEAEEAVLFSKLTSTSTTLALLQRFFDLHQWHATAPMEALCRNEIARLSEVVKSLQAEIKALSMEEFEPFRQAIEQRREQDEQMWQRNRLLDQELEDMRQEQVMMVQDLEARGQRLRRLELGVEAAQRLWAERRAARDS